MSKSSNGVKNWRKRTKQRVIESMGGKCVICKYDKCQNALDLHHINPEEKESSISRIARKNAAAWQKICEELRKCVLLCCRCHREIHAGLIELPETFAKFNEKFLEYKKEKHKFCKCGKRISKHSRACKDCFVRKTKIDWPSYKELARMIEETNYYQVGKKLGVSDNAVRKRIKKHRI